MTTILDTNKMIYTMNELKGLNLSLYTINKMIDNGILKKLNKKYYENLQYTGNFNEFVLAQAYVERGIICLISAASYYNLTTIRPMGIDIAISRKDKVSTIPEWPVLSIHYFTDQRYNEGITLIEDGYQKFKIYDVDKTVADIIYNRKTIGIEETKEILTNYLYTSNKNLNNLYKYSKIIGCDETLNKYMEVLL